MDLKSIIRTFPDFPSKGVLFRDIMPVLRSPKAFGYIVDSLATRYDKSRIDLVAGIESRGFLFGSILALKLGKGFVAVRKRGKLPGKIVRVEYTVEYGVDTIEMQEEAVREGQRVLIVDDLLATGGTAKAAAQLVEKLKGRVAGMAFAIELLYLNGRAKLKGYDICSLVQYE